VSIDDILLKVSLQVLYSYLTGALETSGHCGLEMESYMQPS